jgi:hypothetical protein
MGHDREFTAYLSKTQEQSKGARTQCSWHIVRLTPSNRDTKMTGWMAPEVESGVVTLGVVFIRRNLDRPLQEGPRLAARRRRPWGGPSARVSSAKECGDET